MERSEHGWTSKIALTSWLLVYPKVDEERAAGYVSMLRLVGQQQGMVINEPSHIQMNDDETETYAQTLRRYLNKEVRNSRLSEWCSIIALIQIQLVSIIVKSRRIDRYNLIKRICCVEIPTASEVSQARLSLFLCSRVRLLDSLEKYHRRRR